MCLNFVDCRTERIWLPLKFPLQLCKRILGQPCTSENERLRTKFAASCKRLNQRVEECKQTHWYCCALYQRTGTNADKPPSEGGDMRVPHNITRQKYHFQSLSVSPLTLEAGSHTAQTKAIRVARWDVLCTHSDALEQLQGCSWTVSFSRLAFPASFPHPGALKMWLRPPSHSPCTGGGGGSRHRVFHSRAPQELWI